MGTNPGAETPPDSQDSGLMDIPTFRPTTTAPPVPDALDPDVTTASGPGSEGGASPSPGTSIPAFFKQRSKSYAKIAEALLQAAGAWLNKASGEEDAGAFLPDEDDAETIPPPLGRLAARRIKLGDPGNLTDLEDIGMAAIGISVWLAKGVTSALNARRERRRLLDGAAVHQDEAGQ